MRKRFDNTGPSCLSNKEENVWFIFVDCFYLAESSVSGDVNQVETIERKSSRDSELWKWGFGSDTGGGDTVGLLK